MASQAIGLGNGTDVHVPSLDGDTTAEPKPQETALGGRDGEIEPAHREGEDDEPPEGTEVELEDLEPIKVEGEEYEPGQAHYTGDPKLDALIDHFAAQIKHLNPKNPEHLKTLKRMAQKEHFIQKLQEQNKSLASTQPREPQGPLTEFERTLLEGTLEPSKAAADPEKSPAPSRPAASESPYPYRDAGVNWKSAGDAYVDLGKAWGTAADLAEKGDPSGFQKIADIEAAIFQRRFDDIAIPALAEMLPAVIERVIQHQLGDVIPSAKRVAEQEGLAEARDFALGELAKTPGYEGIQKLVSEEEGEPVEFDGELFPNTPLNRIMAENPWILNIHKPHPKPEVARRLTFLERYRAAYAIYSRGTVDASKARQLLKAGARLEAKKQKEGVRQGLNAGKGNGLSSGQSGSGSYVTELMGAGTGERSFSSL